MFIGTDSIIPNEITRQANIYNGKQQDRDLFGAWQLKSLTVVWLLTVRVDAGGSKLVRDRSIERPNTESVWVKATRLAEIVIL
jgi:hypothetical protein